MGQCCAKPTPQGAGSLRADASARNLDEAGSAAAGPNKVHTVHPGTKPPSPGPVQAPALGYRSPRAEPVVQAVSADISSNEPEPEPEAQSVLVPAPEPELAPEPEQDSGEGLAPDLEPPRLPTTTQVLTTVPVPEPEREPQTGPQTETEPGLDLKLEESTEVATDKLARSLPASDTEEQPEEQPIQLQPIHDFAAVGFPDSNPEEGTPPEAEAAMASSKSTPPPQHDFVLGKETDEPITDSDMDSAKAALEAAENLQGGWKVLKETKFVTIYKNKSDGVCKKYMFASKPAATDGIPMRFPVELMRTDDFAKKVTANTVCVLVLQANVGMSARSTRMYCWR